MVLRLAELGTVIVALPSADEVLEEARWRIDDACARIAAASRAA